MKRGAWVILILLTLPSGCSRSGREDPTVKVVRLPYLSMAPLLIAEREGDFREQDLDVEFVPFRRAGEAIVALSRGQLDVVAGSVNLVLLNAIEKGAMVRIVADKGHWTADSCVVSALLVHPEALQDGTLRTLASLRGQKVDLRENSILSYAYERLLRRDQVTLEDVDLVSLPRSAQLAALENRAVAAVSATDPWLNLFQVSGSAVVWHSINEAVERLQYSVLAYGPSFLTDSPEKGERFMRAYLKGVRRYNQGKTPRNVSLIADETGISASVLSRSCWPEIDEGGRIIPDGLMEYQKWAVGRGKLARVLSLEELWEPRFVESAGKMLQSQEPGKLR
jgi:NitT/TauT family transport system substrate-binding protein